MANLLSGSFQQSFNSSLPSVNQQNDVDKLYNLQEQIWDGRNRKDPVIREQILSCFDKTLQENVPKIQPVIQKIITDNYDKLIKNGTVLESKKPLIDEMAKRLSVAWTMLLNVPDLSRILNDKPLREKLHGREAEYSQRLNQTTLIAPIGWTA